MFGLCQSMKWAHLPKAGGLYDQDPDLLDKFEFIFRAISEEDRRQQEEQRRKDEQRSNKAKATSPRGRGRRR